MNRREAEEFETDLIQSLETYASEYGMDESLAEDIVDRCLYILLDDRNRGIVPIGQRRFSRRPGNLFVDMRHAVESMYSLAAERAPEKELSLVQLMLEAISLIRPDGKTEPGGEETELNGKESCAVCLLHERDMYRRTSEGMAEEELLSGLKKRCAEKDRYSPAHDDIPEAVENLLKAGVLSRKDGKLSITDRVWRKVFPKG